ncbi:hypothetical protein FQA39_LY12172 [Lamprigera yunnana]|nr:hypothetical protein FQA39_LY12172 [Lamprigera yunnana]
MTEGQIVKEIDEPLFEKSIILTPSTESTSSCGSINETENAELHASKKQKTFNSTGSTRNAKIGELRKIQQQKLDQKVKMVNMRITQRQKLIDAIKTGMNYLKNYWTAYSYV